MSEHSREHEALLAALAAGERASTDAEVARRLAECAECAREWAEVQEARRHLEELDVMERDAVEELVALRGTPGEELVLPVLTRLAAAEPHARKRRRPLAAWLTAAAVLVAGAWMVMRLSGDSKVDGPPVTLGDGLELVQPIGRVTSFAPFVWSYEGGADSYEVRIYDAADEKRSTPLLAPFRTERTSWTPAAQELEGLPARVSWTVDALDAYGNVMPGGSRSGEAWRSP